MASNGLESLLALVSRAFVDQAAALSGDTADGTGECLMKRMATLQSTNEELRKKLSDTVGEIDVALPGDLWRSSLSLTPSPGDFVPASNTFLI